MCLIERERVAEEQRRVLSVLGRVCVREYMCVRVGVLHNLVFQGPRSLRRLTERESGENSKNPGRERER